MEKYIAILRGINVSGKNKIQMADLKRELSESGFRNVITYIQSGNLVFEYKKSDNVMLAKKTESVLLKYFMIHVPVIVLTIPELDGIIEANPFIKDRLKKPEHLHVTFLSEKPDTELINLIGGNDTLPDEFLIKNKVVYLYCPVGYGRTKFTNNFFESKLRVAATTRNWKTINKLKELAAI